MENTEVFLGLHDFLERTRHPSAAADIVKIHQKDLTLNVSLVSSIKAFINNAPDPERDSQAAQNFLSNMETAFRTHPLWAGCTEEELESAGELAQNNCRRSTRVKEPRDKLVCIL